MPISKIIPPWGFWLAFFVPSLAFSSDLDLVINEIFYHPPAGLENAEYIELYNRGPDPVNISGWQFDLGINFVIPGGTVVPSDGFLLVVKNQALASSLYRGVRMVGSYFGLLSDGGERLRLLNASGTIIEEFDYSDDDGWPEDADGEGASLERIGPELEPWFADSWAASFTILGSPGKLNTQYRELVDLNLIAAGEDWRYQKGTAEPSAFPGDWAKPGFDDSAWLTGPTGIGYGDNDDATVLADMQNAYTTVYMRKRFDVADPNDLEALTFSVNYDDGYVLYLNGAEVDRKNVGGAPGSPLPFDALALGNREATSVELVDLTSQRSLLAAGTNVFAIQVVNQAIGSSDLSMIPALASRKLISGVDTSLNRIVSSTVIPQASPWKYFKGTVEPAPALGEWTASGFDDAAWPDGPAGFGYGDNDDNTVLSDMLNGYTTVYIRKAFTVSDLASVAGMSLGMSYDDGFIAYLNGVEVARAFAPGAAGTFQPRTALASGSHEAVGEEVFDLASKLSALAAGANILAVQGFNSSLASGDFSLHPRLTLFTAVQGDPQAITAGVSINEVFNPPAGDGWVEIANCCSSAVELSGFGLSHDGAVPLRYAFSPGTVLVSGGFLTVAESSLGLALPYAGTLLLTDAAGVVLVDGKRYEIRDPGLPSGCYPDAKGEFVQLSSPTPDLGNAPPPDFGIRVNEIMYHPLGAPGAPELEWIELVNSTAAAVNLTGWEFTRGIDYEIPNGTVIAAGGYLVVAGDPAGVEARYGITGVLGGYTSGLKNDDELIVLRDHLGNVANRIHYADDGRWPAAADGAGPSLELVHPALDNRIGHAWRASAGEGTPGAQNSRFALSAPPVVSRLKHFPPVPQSGQAAQVTLEAAGLDPIAEVRLFHRAAGSPPPPFAVIVMLDDGLSGDGTAGDGVYGASLPGQPNGAVVEFFIEAEDAAGNVQVIPSTAPAQNNLYLVASAPPSLGVPLYRLIMTPADRSILETRDVRSNEELNAAFISGGDIFYRVGVHYRGKSSRFITPKSYRVNFTDDEEFEGAKHLNLNANRPQHQHLGMGIFRGAGVPASLTRVVRFAFASAADLTYTRMEEVGDDFLRRYYSTPTGEDGGNLYRGEETGNLDYRGNDPDSYRSSYKKETNEEEDDWADLIHLCDVLTNTPESAFAAAVQEVADVEEWTRFFAVHTLISTQEGGLYRDRGDDYFLYRRPSDGKFVLIPWDIDDSFSNPTERLFRPTLFQIRRILEHPDFTPLYYSHLVRLGGSHASLERMADLADQLAGLFPAAALSNDLAFVQARLNFVDSQINQQFTVGLDPESIVAAGAAWSFFRGRSEPSGGTLDWTAPGFDDSSWEIGPSGFGYGDNDDATLLSDMLNGYSTIYIRHAFAVPDPAAFAALELAIDYDDGFIAFLNGVEIARSNAGAAGAYPAFSGLAAASREAGAFQVFDLVNPEQLLVSGSNVLAVVGLNAAIDSTDFSLKPTLRTSGVVGQGCAGDFFVTGGRLLLSGKAPVTQTRYVRVDGQDAAYDHISGAWSFSAPLASAVQTVNVQAIDASLAVVASQALDLTRVSTAGGQISASTTWETARSPFLVTSSIAIPAGVRLTIEPGCQVLIEAGAGFSILGEIKALGDAAGPITFKNIPCHANWGGFNFSNSRFASAMDYCEFTNVTGNPACLVAGNSNLDLNNCHIHDIAGEGVSAFGSTTNLRNCIVERTNEALSLDFGITTVEFNIVRNVIGKSDLCDANGSNNPPARIAFNTMYGTSDDAIDADRGSVNAEGNILRNCGDQAISLVGAGNSTVLRNLCFRNGIGLAVKDSHVCLATFNTFANNSLIGVRAIEKNAGQGGGVITLKNSIVWGNPTSLFVNSTGSITTSYSCVQGTPVPGPGNIDLDPQFVNPAASDFHLQSTSPCIGAAENGDDLGALPFEIQPRAPGNLVVTATTADSISLSWNDNSWAEDGYQLERRISQGFTPAYLIRRGDAWKFFRGVAEPSGGAGDWTEIGFDDAGWEQGPTGIGYGDGDDATVLLNMQNNYTTVYARRAFTVADPSAYATLELIIDYDDGFVAWLNGVEIARANSGSPKTAVAYNALATGQHEAGADPVVVEFSTAGLLAAGANVLAVQGLNATLGSTDFSLIPELRTADPTPFELLAALPPNSHNYSDGGLRAGTLYSYRVRAVNAQGPSAYSNIVSRETADLPAAPSGLVVTGVTGASISLSWVDNSTVETSFELERAAGGGDFALLAALPANTQTSIDTGLTIGQTYSYRVRALNSFGASAYSNTVTQETGDPPAAPSGLAVSNVLVEALELSWIDNSSNETAFELEIRAGAGAFQRRALLPPDTTVYLDQGLASGQSFTYRVRAVNDLGPSAYSNEVTAEPGRLPAAPADLTVTAAGLDSISLHWIDASDNETSFALERRGPSDADFAPLAVLEANTITYTDAGLPPDTTFAYRLRAVNAFGSSAASNETTGTTGRLPQPPSSLTITFVGLGTINLSWIDNEAGETGFEIERRSGAGDFARLADLPADSVAYSNTGLAEGTAYAYRVRAVNTFGPSGWSNEAAATTARLPAAPSGLALVDLGVSAVTFSWTDNADNETAFEIERSDGGGPFAVVGHAAQNAVAFTDQGLLSGAAYRYQVRAVNAHGSSPPSPVLAVITGKVPTAPSNLAITVLGLDSIRLDWDDNSDNEDGFELERRTGAGTFVKVADLPAGSTAHVDGGLSPGTSYSYRLRAVNSFGASDYAGPAGIATGYPPPEIAALLPAEGPAAGGTLIVITGKNFAEVNAITVGGEPIGDLIVVSLTEIHGTTPPGGRGDAEVKVITASGRATGAFAYYDVYRRGDVNRDGELDIADAVYHLIHVFLGGSPPPCDEVARINEGEDIDQSDAVYLLLHLFLGGPAPEPKDAKCY
ncbi:MAG: lamin tail domain-containing protein [Planctomycetes bacterium]|nr:lamin tail domain-containing protein [Planctomycetota bacterium]